MNNNMYGSPTPMGPSQNMGYGQPMGGNMVPKSNQNILMILGIVAAVVVIIVIVVLSSNDGGKKYTCTRSYGDGDAGVVTVKQSYEFNKTGDKLRTVTVIEEFKGGSTLTDEDIQEMVEEAQEDCDYYKDRKIKSIKCKVSKSGKTVTKTIVQDIEHVTEEEEDALDFDMLDLSIGYTRLTYDSLKAQAQESDTFMEVTCQ